MNDTIMAASLSVPETNLVFSIDSLRTRLDGLADPRSARGVRYQLADLLVLLILAKLCGEDTIMGMAEWLRWRCEELTSMLQLSRSSLPHHTTYRRLLEVLDVEHFEEIVGEFFSVQVQQTTDQVTLNIDGKALRGTIPKGKSQGVHLLAVYEVTQGVVLMQVEVDQKENEIAAAPRLLECLDLRGCVVTGDAMFTQRELCQQIVKAEGDYVFPVKDNQPTLRHDISTLFDPAPVSAGHSCPTWNWLTASSVNKCHGRIEYRYLTASTQLNDYLDWPHVKQVFRLQRVVHHTDTNRLTYQVVFGITSLTSEQFSPDELLSLIRKHWHIENRLHYVRDVTFHEDACKIRQTRQQRFLASLNNVTIGLIRQQDFKYVPAARRFFNAKYHLALKLLL
jgi:predicted transposase YbfD/YdcC